MIKHFFKNSPWLNKIQKNIQVQSTLLLTFPFLLFSFLTFSCSLDYGSNVEDTEHIPELIFTNVKMERTEDAVKTISLNAETLEQYKDGGLTYAKNVIFSNYDEDGNVTVKGECALIGADTDSEIYTLYDKVLITSYDQDMQIQAKNLRWNSKTEQLASGSEDLVTITSGGISPDSDSTTRTSIKGTGFSASSISSSYRFDSNISGTIITDADSQSNGESQN